MKTAYVELTLARLYASAQETEPDCFHAGLRALIGTLVPCDGVILESRHVSVITRHEGLTPQDGAAERMAAILSHVERQRDNAASIDFFAALTKPHIVNCKSHWPEHSLPWLRELSALNGPVRFLMYGDVPAPQYVPNRIVLFRLGERDFTESEADLVHAYWPHIGQAIDINLDRALSRVDPEHARRALSLINAFGVIEIADARLLDLLRMEWPEFNGYCLPPPVLSALLDAGVYRGMHIELSAVHKFGYLVCSGKHLPIVNTLSPSERTAVQCFARGMSNSEIADRLGVSRHTIRNQLASAYQKLRIHSKTELIRLMSSG